MADWQKITYGAISIIVGCVLLPVCANFVYDAKWNNVTSAGGTPIADTNVTGVAGLSSLLNLVLYGFTFGLIGLGIGLIYIGLRN